MNYERIIKTITSKINKKLGNINILDKLMLVYTTLYFLIGLLTLKSFPTIYTDEIWFGESSYNLSNTGSSYIKTNLYFYNTTAYWGNIFIYLNAFTIKILGYNIFSLRLITFICFTLMLIIIYILLNKLFNKNLAFIYIILYSLHPSSLHLSRIARPEGINIFFLILSIYIFHKISGNLCYFKAFLLGILFSFPFFSHTLGFLSLLVGLFLLTCYFPPLNKKNTIYIFMYLIGLLPSIIIFLYNYYQNYKYYAFYGAGRKALTFTIAKLYTHLNFLYSGFELQYNLIYLFIFITILSLFAFIKLYKIDKYKMLSIFLFFLIFFIVNLCIFLLSPERYYFGYIFLFALIILIVPIYYIRYNHIFNIIVIILFFLFLFENILWIHYIHGANYEIFSRQLTDSIPKNSNVLGRVNYKISFIKNYNYIIADDLFKYCLLENEGTIEKYVKKYKIEYIIYDYGWDMQSRLGNKSHGTPLSDTKNFLKKNTILISTIKEQFYSNRFNWIYLPNVELIKTTLNNNTKNEIYWTKIYKVNKNF